MLSRNNLLKEWFDQFVDVRHVAEPNPVWVTTNGCRAHRTYIDEMAVNLRTLLDEEYRERIYEKLTRPFEIERETKKFLQDFTADRKVLSTIANIAKVEVEPEEVNPEEFEKILNGG